MSKKDDFRNGILHCLICGRAVLDNTFKQCEWCSFQFDTTKNPPTLDGKAMKISVEWTEAFQSHDSAGDEAEPFCGKCETYLEMEFNFCPNCGVELDWGLER